MKSILAFPSSIYIHEKEHRNKMKNVEGKTKSMFSLSLANHCQNSMTLLNQIPFYNQSSFFNCVPYYNERPVFPPKETIFYCKITARISRPII